MADKRMRADMTRKTFFGLPMIWRYDMLVGATPGETPFLSDIEERMCSEIFVFCSVADQTGYTLANQHCRSHPVLLDL